MKEIMSKVVDGNLNNVNKYLEELQEDYTIYQVIELERLPSFNDYGYSVKLLVEKK